MKREAVHCTKTEKMQRMEWLSYWVCKAVLCSYAAEAIFLFLPEFWGWGQVGFGDKTDSWTSCSDYHDCEACTSSVQNLADFPAVS